MLSELEAACSSHKPGTCSVRPSSVAKASIAMSGVTGGTNRARRFVADSGCNVHLCSDEGDLHDAFNDFDGEEGDDDDALHAATHARHGLSPPAAAAAGHAAGALASTADGVEWDGPVELWQPPHGWQAPHGYWNALPAGWRLAG